MKISILSWDLSHNCLGRALVIGQLLQNRFEVEIAGPCFGKEIWKPFPTGGFNLKPVSGKYHPFYLLTRNELERSITGDLLYAVKPRPSSFGLALGLSRKRGLPVILDIDDDEPALFHPFYRFLNGCHTVFIPNGYLWTRRLQKRIPEATAVSTASRYFQARYGGIHIPHARDHTILDPVRFDPGRAKQDLGLIGRSVIMFLGTPRPHKGIDIILKALGKIPRLNPVLVMIGPQPRPKYARELKKLAGGRLVLHPEIPFGRQGEYLSAADLVVLPQLASDRSAGQVPAKLIDAMMMARPIIASTGSADVESILDGCGVLIPPGDIAAVAEQMDRLLSDPGLCRMLGDRAREKAVQEFSLDVHRPRMERFVETVTGS